jgi:hypothetical protein
VSKKKLLAVLISIFLAIIVLGAIGIGLVVFWGSTLDKESKAYANSAIPAIVMRWSEKELLDRASPEFKKAITIDELDRLFRWFSGLGRLEKYEGAEGEAILSATSQTGRLISAEYTASAIFQKGEATVKIRLIKHGNQWQILSFRIDSRALVPP